MRIQAAAALLGADPAVRTPASVRRTSSLRHQARPRPGDHPVAARARLLDHVEHPRSHRAHESVQADSQGPIPGLGHLVLPPIPDCGRTNSSNFAQRVFGRFNVSLFNTIRHIFGWRTIFRMICLPNWLFPGATLKINEPMQMLGCSCFLVSKVFSYYLCSLPSPFFLRDKRPKFCHCIKNPFWLKLCP